MAHSRMFLLQKQLRFGRINRSTFMTRARDIYRSPSGTVENLAYTIIRIKLREALYSSDAQWARLETSDRRSQEGFTTAIGDTSHRQTGRRNISLEGLGGSLHPGRGRVRL